MKLAKIKQYCEILILCGSLLSGLWLGIVKPALNRIIHQELTFIHFCLFEIMTEKQHKNALQKYQHYQKQIKE